MKRGIDNGIANSILINFNRIGSLTKLWLPSRSPRRWLHCRHLHRSGETEARPSPTWLWVLLLAGSAVPSPF
ncbi:hypothetical protein ACNKHQ_16035 [Shigella flexneri]